MGVGNAFQASHQFQGISGDTNFFLIFDEDGEEVMKGVGSAAGGNLTYQFGDNGTAANGTFFEVADGTNNGQFKLRKSLYLLIFLEIDGKLEKRYQHPSQIYFFLQQQFHLRLIYHY